MAKSWPVQVHLVGSPSGPILYVEGDVDVATADLVEEKLRLHLEGEDGAVTVDLSEVRWADSTCVRILLRAHEALARHSRRLLVRGASPRVVRTFRVLGLAHLLQAA